MKTLEKGLRKMRVLTLFKRNYRRDRKGAYYNVVLALTKDLNSEMNRLGGAFTWSETKEGYNFWSDIHEQLENYFDDIQ